MQADDRDRAYILARKAARIKRHSDARSGSLVHHLHAGANEIMKEIIGRRL